jgi:hypothetical protein
MGMDLHFCNELLNSSTVVACKTNDEGRSLGCVSSTQNESTWLTCWVSMSCVWRMDQWHDDLLWYQHYATWMCMYAHKIGNYYVAACFDDSWTRIFSTPCIGVNLALLHISKYGFPSCRWICMTVARTCSVYMARRGACPYAVLTEEWSHV